MCSTVKKPFFQKNFQKLMLVSTLPIEVIMCIWIWMFHFFLSKIIHFIDEINKFLSKDLGSRFELFYPQFILTVKSKFDYIICRKF